MSNSKKINHLVALVFALLIVDRSTFAQTQIDPDNNLKTTDLKEQVAETTTVNCSDTSRQERSMTESPDEPMPVLDDVYNRILKVIKSPIDGQNIQLNESNIPLKRDLRNQSLALAEMDALVYDDNHNGPDRHIQYDTIGEPVWKDDSSEEKINQLSRYMMANESLADEQPQSDAAQETHHSQQRSPAVQGRAITRESKISKPPYAAGDRFSNHHSPPFELTNELPLLNVHKGATNVIAELIPVNQENNTDIRSSNGGYLPANSTNHESNTELANSIKRISTNLVNDYHKEMLKEPQPLESFLEKQEFQKLVPVNSLVELNPIPLDELAPDQQPSVPKEPWNEWEGNSLKIHNPAGPSNSNNFNPPSSVYNSLQYSSYDLLRSKLAGTRPSLTESLSAAESPDPPTGTSSRTSSDLLTRKTFEVVSNQLKQPQQQYQSPGENQVWETNSQNSTSAVNSNNIVHRAEPVTHYAASLTNVTAPLIPPHSATEAMESSLGQQAGREILQQVSGFLRQTNHTQQQHQRTPQAQPRQPASDIANSQSIYLPSANSLTPQGQQPRLPVHELLSTSMSQIEPITSTTATNGSFDRRLVNFSYNRRPSQQQPPSQQASGFRSRFGAMGITTSQASPGGNHWNSPYLTSYLNMPLAVASSQDSAPLVATSSTNSNGLALPSGSQNASSTSSTPASSFSSPSTTGSLASSTSNGFITNGAIMPSSEQQQQISSTSGPTSIATTPATSTSAFAGSSSTLAMPSPSPSPSESTGPNAGQTAVGLNRRVFNLTRVEHISAECSNDLIRTIIVFNGTFRGMIYSSGHVRDSSCIYVNGTGKTRYDFSIRLNQCGTLARQELHPAGKDNDVRRRDQVMWNTLSIQYNPIIEQEWDEHFRVSCEYGSDFWKTISFNPFNVETNTGSPVVFTVDPPQCQMEILRGHGMVGPRQETISGPVTVGDPLTLLIHMKSERAGYDILVKNCIAHDNVKQRMQLIDSNGCVVNERFISPFRGTYNDNDLKHVTLYAYLKAFRFTGSPILYLECEIHMCQSSCPPQMCYWRRLSKRSALSPNGTQTMQYLEDDSIDETQPINSLSSLNSTGLNVGQNLKRSRKGRKMSEIKQENLSDKMSLTQSLLVRPIDDPDAAAYSMQQQQSSSEQLDKSLTSGQLLCYRRVEVLAFLLATGSLLLMAMSITVVCCWQQTNKLKRLRRSNLAEATNRSLCGGSSSLSSLSSANSSSSPYMNNLNLSLAASSAQIRSIGRPYNSTSIRQSPIGRHKERLLVI